MNLDTTLFEYGALVYPQPIALACGRICRARHTSEQLEAILKCAETVSRYVAAVALCSFAARTDAAIAPPPTFSDFKGNLSFGHFLSLLQGIAKVGGEHPIAPVLQASFVPKAKGTSAAADAALTALLKQRN